MTSEMGQPKVGSVAFNVLAAMSYDKGYAQLWSLRSYPTVRPADFSTSSPVLTARRREW